MENFVLKDQAARDVISNDIGTNLMVEAGAGSGKTSEMAKRIIALINGGYRTIDEIVAITFTRKAANELRERVRSELEKEYHNSGNEFQKKALDQIHECFIGTIHAFCGKMLRERPIEAGVDPGFEEIDEARDLMIRHKIWADFVRGAGEEEKRILHWMDVFGVKEEASKNFLRTVCDHQDALFTLPNEPEKTTGVIIEEIKGAVIHLWELVRVNYDEIPEEIRRDSTEAKELQKSMIEFYRKMRDACVEEMPQSQLVNVLMLFSTSTSVKVTQKNWGDTKEAKANAKALGQEFADLRAAEIVPLIESIDAFVYNHLLIPFAMKAKDIYLKHKLAVAELNFQDLLMKSADLLRDFKEVRAYFQNKYKTLLIDEFQDTDPIQVQIAMYLVGQETTEKRWNKITPKEGSLFVVGDPKQSIYGFRRADIRIYNRFKERILSTGGKFIELNTNFRSVNALGEWYNAAFPTLLNEEGQAQFTEANVVMPESEGTLAGVTYYEIDEAKKPAVMAAEPENLARIIRHLVSRKEITERKGNDEDGNPIFGKRLVRYKDIMVLVMKKRLLEPIANGVAACGIPVKITGADITKRTNEFISFADLIRMLAYPEENAYIHNVMRGDFYGFSDQELFRFHDLGGQFSIYFDLEPYIKEKLENQEDIELFERIKTCFMQFRRFSNYIKNLVPAAATERIIEDMGIMGMHLVSDEKLAGLGSFVSLIEKIRLKKITDIWGLDLFINELSFMIENGFEEDIDIEGKDFNAVRMMNTHKAKGLEAPIVILAAPCSGKTMEPTFYTECVEDERAGDQYFGYARVDKNPDSLYGKKYFAPATWTDIEGDAKRSEDLERDRLLYVAATRARNLLIIGDSKARENPWQKLFDLRPMGAENILREVYAEEDQIQATQEPEKATLSLGGLRKPEKFTLTPDELQKSIGEIKAFRNDAFNANKATYGLYTPSSEKGKKEKDNENAPVSHEQEKKILENTMEIIIDGEEAKIKAARLGLGSIVHKLFEIIVKNEAALETVMKEILAAERADFINEELLGTIVSKFKASELYKRIQSADDVYTEVPFTFKVQAGEAYAGQTMEKDTHVNGIIDLVFKENGRWVIVDYKTCDKNEVKHELEVMYKPQLNAYKDVWERTTGENVADLEIYFVEKQNILQN